MILSDALRFKVNELEEAQAEILRLTEEVSSHALALADAQFIGYSHGKDRGLIALVGSMGLTKDEWEQWKVEYGTSYLTDREIEEVDEHYKLISNGKGE